MKLSKTLAVAALLAVAVPASAQFSNGGAKSSTAASADGWNTVWVQWNPSSLNPDKGDSESFTGLSLGYSKAFSVSQSIPLFVEAGIGLQYSFHSEDMTDDFELDDYGLEVKDKFHMLSAKVPISLIYAWQIPNSSITLMPNLGLDLRFNISGKEKLDFSGEYADEIEEALEEEGYDLEANLFDKDEMGGSDYVWKRLQIGWHIGVKARFNEKFLVGLSYGTDFSEISKKVKISTASITLGYTF